MIKKFLFLFICVALVATIVGCSLHSGHGHGPANADLSTTLSGTVRDDGTLAEITFASGAKVSAPTAGTMQPNVVVTVTESKTSEIGANAIGTPSYIYLYTITAVLTSDNNLTEDVLVSSLEQPLSISLPTNYLGTSGVCYVGIRFSPDEPWQYRAVSDNGTIALALRGSNAIPAECNINLYRPNIQIALFVYEEKGESASSTANISVSGMTATSTPIVDIKDEVYQNDLTVKLSLEGANLNGLNASDLTAAVTYRSSRETPVTVKANGTTVSQTTASDKAVTGANYTHTFKVSNLAFDTQLGTTADLSFVINTKDMNASDFPTEFLIELNGVSENVIGGSFVCSEYFAFETASLNENMFSIAYDLAGGNLEEGVSNPTAYGEASETFTLNNPVKSGNTFAGWTGTGLEEATMEVTIAKGSTGNREYTATWTENPPDTYNITYSGIDGATFEADKLTSYNVGSLPVTLNNPSKTGYTFTGWTWEGQSEAVLEATIAQNSTGDKEYTANWSINSYNLNLIAGTGIATVTGSGTYEYNANVTASCTMLAGYEFASWTGDFTTGTFNMPAQNATMTANASLISYSISYDLASGTLATANPTSYDVTSATITLNNPTREGFAFVGWTGTGIATGTASQTLTIPLGSTGNRSYVASWTAALSNVITFNLPNSVTLEVRKCPAGTFVRDDSKTVTISKDFYMGTYEFTNAQYIAINGSAPSSNQDDNCPVEQISWTTANAFCETLNTQLASQIPTGYKFALPTEAQWEYACRAGTTTDFNNGKNMLNADDEDANLNEVAYYLQNWGGSIMKTHSVGGLASNTFGLYDMHGNVYEWCSDWYGDYSSENLTDPTGAETGSFRVLRGGSWGDDPDYCRSSYRDGYDPGNVSIIVGFRVALVPVP